MESSEFRLRVVTLNCYLLPPSPFLDIVPGVPDRQKPEETLQRIRDICGNILSNDYDIVCLQEVWMENHKEVIVSSLKHKYPHHSWFPFGYLPGSGLLTLTKFPLLHSYFHRFQLEDSTFPFGSIDSICGKGASVNLLQFESYLVTVINTHPQSEQVNDSKDAIRLRQIWEIATLARHSRVTSDLVIVCGDFNAAPGFVGMKVFHELTCARDSFVAAENKSSHRNTYACKDNNLVEKKYINYYPSGVRIDYIFFVEGTGSKLLSEGDVSCEVTRQRPWGRLGHESGIPFSDHEAVDTQISWIRKKAVKNQGDQNEFPIVIVTGLRQKKHRLRASKGRFSIRG